MRRLAALVLAGSVGLAVPALGDDLAPATLVVVPVGGWARVTVDGEDRGLGPVTLALPPGTHRVRLPESEFHPATEREVVLAPGERLELTMARPLKDAWVEARGWPPGTSIEVDGGPGPVADDGVRLVIRDGLQHRLTFRCEGQVLREIAVQRCVTSGCLLPGELRVVEWTPPSPRPSAEEPPSSQPRTAPP